MANYSRKHHYLPVFFLKGFCDEDGLLYVYDKINKKILTKQKPESKFYENDLNNYKFEGDIKFSLEETVFNRIDGDGSQLFKRLKDGEFDDDISALDKFRFLGFITRLFWRSPQTHEVFAALIQKEGLSNESFGFVNKKTGKVIPDNELEDIKTQFINDIEIQKIFKHSVPLSAGGMEEIYNLYNKWGLYSNKNESLSFITGDNSFLIKNDSISLNNIFNELIFPLNKKTLLILSEKHPQFLDNILITHVNLSIFHQSERFVATDSEQQIVNILEHYKKLEELKLNHSLPKNLFQFLQYQSRFSDFNDYRDDYLKQKK